MNFRFFFQFFLEIITYKRLDFFGQTVIVRNVVLNEIHRVKQIDSSILERAFGSNSNAALFHILFFIYIYIYTLPPDIRILC